MAFITASTRNTLCGNTASTNSIFNTEAEITLGMGNIRGIDPRHT